MIPVGGIINASSKIAEFFGLVEGVSTQITKLVHQAFNSAKSNLENARYATGQNQLDYIKRAKDCFIDAAVVEENENKILALVGLSMCQYMLGDTINAKRNFNSISDVKLTRAEKAKYAAMDVLQHQIPGSSGTYLHARKTLFSNLQERAINSNRTFIF